MSQILVTGEAKIRDIQGPVVANSGVITALDGAASQYVRGDGTLADFPTSTGGGSSVSYYLNSSVSQGTIGGVAYRELSKDPIIGAGTDITISANGYVANYITDANDPDVTIVPGGNFNCEFYFSVNNNTGNPTTYAELYKYDGTTFTLLGTSAGVPESINQGTTIAPYYFAIPVATAALSVTDRLAIRIYVSVDGRTVTLHTENGHLCQVVTTLSKGMVSLNNLTDQSQYLTTGTSGTNFAIVSSGDTHTFNLPVASATNTGKLSNTDWSTFNNKVPYTGATANVDLGIWDLDAASLFSNGLGVYIKKNVSGIANSVDYVALSSSTYKLNVAEASSGSNAKIFNFDFSTLSDTTLSVNNTRTYTLPDASGTLALTSNLSAYVPYTGATGNVDLGLFGITSNAVKAIGDNSTYGGVISIKQNNVIGGLIGTGYTELFGKTNRLGISFGAGSIAYLSNSVLTAERTYTLPDLSGTLALLEGSQTFSGSKTFSVTTIQDAGIVLKDGVYPTPSTGYVGFASNGAGVTIVRRSGVTSYNNNFQFPLSSNDYNFPNITGTVALLEGTQTFTGVKSFDTGILLKNGVVTTTSGYTGIGAGTSGINVSLGSGGGGLLIFQSTSYNYTFPAATGTIALTSNLSTYVPYTGATANVDLGIRALFAQNIVVGQTSTQGYIHFKTGGSTAISADTCQAPYGTNGMIYSFDQTGGNYKQFVIDSSSLTNNTIRTYTMPDATGTLALTSNLSAYLPLTGGTLTGNLTINPSTTDYTLTVSTSTTNNTIKLLGSTASNTSTIGYWSSNGGTGYGALNFTPTNTRFEIVNGGSFSIYTSGNERLTIASTGAATFSSSVTADSLVSNGGGQINTTVSPFVFFNSGGGGNAKKFGLNMTNLDGFKIYSLNDNGTTRKDNIIFANIDGNVGIGTSSPDARLTVATPSGSSEAIRIICADTIGDGFISYYRTSGQRKAFIGYGGSNDDNFYISQEENAPTLFFTNNTERMRITSGGEILVSGTYNPYAFANRGNITMNGTNSNIIAFTNGSAVRGHIFHNQTDMEILNKANGTMTFWTNDTERLRITSGGNVLIGQTTASGSTNGIYFRVGIESGFIVTNDNALQLSRYSSNGDIETFFRDGTKVGSISVTTTLTSYNVTSDYRLKQDLKDYNALDLVSKIKTYDYQWKVDSSRMYGVVAHELAEVIPYAVKGEKNAEEMQQVDYSKLVPILVKAIQEQQAQIEELKSMIAAK